MSKDNQYTDNLNAALEKGDKIFQGKPCRKGHAGMRYVKNGQLCVDCVAVNNFARDQPHQPRIDIGGFFHCHGCKTSKPRSTLDKRYRNRHVCTDCTSAEDEHRAEYTRMVAIAAPAPSRIYTGASL